MILDQLTYNEGVILNACQPDGLNHWAIYIETDFEAKKTASALDNDIHEIIRMIKGHCGWETRQ